VRQNRRRGGRCRTRGAALIEAALVLPVLFILVFGIIEIGMLVDTATVTSNASRNGARLASANYGDAGASERDDVLDAVRTTVEESLNSLPESATPQELWIYEANANGYPGAASNFSSCASSCIRYTWDGDGFANPAGSWNDPDACGSSLDRIGVYVAVRHEFLTHMLGAGKTVDEHTVMRLEPEVDCS
jgi:hypothetical protein